MKKQSNGELIKKYLLNLIFHIFRSARQSTVRQHWQQTPGASMPLERHRACGGREVPDTSRCNLQVGYSAREQTPSVVSKKPKPKTCAEKSRVPSGEKMIQEKMRARSKN